MRHARVRVLQVDEKSNIAHVYYVVYVSRRKETRRLGDLLTSGPSNCFVDASYFSFGAREVLNSNHGLVSHLIWK